MDQSGERMYDKNMHSNPRDPLMRINLALAIWFCLKQGQFEDCGNFFQAKNSKDGTGSSCYCGQLAKLFLTFKDVLNNYIQSNHCNGHGIRKGAGTFAICVEQPFLHQYLLSQIMGTGPWAKYWIFTGTLQKLWGCFFGAIAGWHGSKFRIFWSPPLPLYDGRSNGR
jgi:hypothetical protein